MIKIHGVPLSQAVRAVLWVLFNKELPFELVLTVPGSKAENGTRHPDYLNKFPNGTIPALEDPQTGFLLAESHAIMCYLCNKYEWVDLYPKGHEERAKIDDFLHYHHRNIKEASLAYFAPMARPDLGLTDDVINMAKRLFKNGLNALENQWLKKNNYICGDKATIADMAAYVEVGQLQSQFTNLFNFEPFPNINRWLERMTQMKGHDDVHLVLSELGNINITPPVMEDLMGANIKGFKHISNKINGFSI
ncbi:glutathione S-transferase family protein [SAR86 cluster bacterium]|nr:glutathione S-transferase family protein [SAR86 cluster bacterium]